MSNMFETMTQSTTKIVMIESITMVGSAFAVTMEGHQVYVSKRIVDTLDLSVGDAAEAVVIPNYEDKQHIVPWRAMRLSKVDLPVGIAAAAKTIPVPDPVVNKGDLIVNLIEKHGPLRTSVIANELKIDQGEASTLCLGLFSEGRVSMAEVHGAPSQKRASLRVWGIDINDFDVDPYANT